MGGPTYTSAWEGPHTHPHHGWEKGALGAGPVSEEALGSDVAPPTAAGVEEIRELRLRRSQGIRYVYKGLQSEGFCSLGRQALAPMGFK